MQVGVDVTYMHTNFGECDLSGFRDIATFKNGQISLSTYGLKTEHVQHLLERAKVQLQRDFDAWWISQVFIYFCIHNYKKQIEQNSEFCKI